MNDKMKINSPKEILEKRNKTKTISIDYTGSLENKLKKEYELLYDKPIKKENSIKINWMTIFLIIILFLIILGGS